MRGRGTAVSRGCRKADGKGPAHVLPSVFNSAISSFSAVAFLSSSCCLASSHSRGVCSAGQARRGRCQRLRTGPWKRGVFTDTLHITGSLGGGLERGLFCSELCGEPPGTVLREKRRAVRQRAYLELSVTNAFVFPAQLPFSLSPVCRSLQSTRALTEPTAPHYQSSLASKFCLTYLRLHLSRPLTYLMLLVPAAVRLAPRTRLPRPFAAP